MVKLVVFDLDGTLLDTIKDLAISLNMALKKNNIPQKPQDDYYKMVGSGVDKLIERATKLTPKEDEFIKVRKDFQEFYKRHSGDNTYVYEGVLQLLERLQENGIKLAILSNKDDCFIDDIVKDYFGSVKFEIAMGKRSEFEIKPNPASLNYIIDRLKLKKSEVLYVGDSKVDIKTAQNCGVKGVGAVWGFSGEEELVKAGANFLAYSPLEVLKYI